MADDLYSFFGRVTTNPAEHSAAKLLLHLGSTLRLGQWELSRAAIHTLHEEHPKLTQSILRMLVVNPLYARWSVLYALVYNPNSYRLCYSICLETIPTPHHLAWLCAVEYTRLFPEEPLPKELLEHIELNVTLFQAFPDRPPIREASLSQYCEMDACGC